jgi:hypothetical protein
MSTMPFLVLPMRGCILTSADLWCLLNIHDGAGYHQTHIEGCISQPPNIEELHGNKGDIILGRNKKV